MTTIRVLAFDIGKTGAYAIGDVEDGKTKVIIKNETKRTSLSDLELLVDMLLDVHEIDVILFPHPVRYYNVMRVHWQDIAIINLVAERYDIQTIEVKDSQAKKAVLGNGKAKKEKIMEHFGEESEHIADCLLFLTHYSMICQE